MTKGSSAEVLICGAGIGGISAAYHPSVRHGIEHILLVDQGAPLSLTSDNSTEFYRNLVIARIIRFLLATQLNQGGQNGYAYLEECNDH